MNFGTASGLIQAMRTRLGDQVVTDPETVAEHSHDRSHHEWARAAALVRCASTDDVVSVARVCTEFGAPMIPLGAGTGLEGGANASADAIVVDVSGMDGILAVDPASLNATVQPGVRRSKLNPVLREHGLFFPAGPGVDASIGGMVSTRASGTNAVRYGTLSDVVLGLKVVLADGRVIATGGRARKSAAGYDLTHLFTGSEGTLGIITEITVKLFSIPEFAQLITLSFTTIRAAARTVQESLGAGIELARAELLDAPMVEAINSYSRTAFPVFPTLMVEVAGERRHAITQLDRVREIARSFRSVGEVVVPPGPETDRLWQARHDALPACAALRPGAVTWSTDVCVPLSALADCIAETVDDLAANDVIAPIAGHVGDGNFHLAFVLRPGKPDEWVRARAIYGRLIDRAIAAGGTSTGEHGVGVGKRADLLREHAAGIEVMRAIKKALDPDGLLNPGKVLA